MHCTIASQVYNDSKLKNQVGQVHKLCAGASCTGKKAYEYGMRRTLLVVISALFQSVAWDES